MATIKYNPQLRAFVNFLVHDYVELVIKSTGDGGLVAEVLGLSVVKEWTQNAEENIFAESYTELDSDDVSWMRFLLSAVERQDGDDTLEHMVSTVEYRLEEGGKITVFSKRELNSLATEFFEKSTVFEDLEDEERKKFLNELNIESFGFMDYVRELSASLKS